MNENKSPELSGEDLRRSASESVREGGRIRDKVHDLTLHALRSRRFDRQAIRDVVGAITEGIALGADTSRADLRQTLADAFRGVDEALTKSAEAGRQAVGQLVASGRDLSDTEIRQALANLKKLEDDFLSTAGRVAEAANEKVRPELRQLVHTARHAGTETGKAVAATMADLAQRFSLASLDLALAGLEAASEVGSRFAQLVSGILGGVADALSKPDTEKKEP